MKELDALILVLEASSVRQPEKPLTNTHLLNIAKMARRVKARHDEGREDALNTAYEEAIGEDLKWGKD